MSLTTRTLLLTALLLAGWLGQLALQRHVASAGAPAAVTLPVPLSTLPRDLGAWRGVDRPVDNPQLRLGVDRLHRVYRLGHSGPTAEVWLIHSTDGSDRYHHPEICMAVAGQIEDSAGRAEISVPGHASPIQQYRFGTSGEYQLVYYWHYTLLPPAGGDRDAVQRLYDRLHWRPASVTIQVFVPEPSSDIRPRAHEFVQLLDEALQELLPATAARGRQRAPVTVLD